MDANFPFPYSDTAGQPSGVGNEDLFASSVQDMLETRYQDEQLERGLERPPDSNATPVFDEWMMFSQELGAESSPGIAEGMGGNMFLDGFGSNVADIFYSVTLILKPWFSYNPRTTFPKAIIPVSSRKPVAVDMASFTICLSFINFYSSAGSSCTGI
jgi:hypothetical protein